MPRTISRYLTIYQRRRFFKVGAAPARTLRFGVFRIVRASVRQLEASHIAVFHHRNATDGIGAITVLVRSL